MTARDDIYSREVFQVTCKVFFSVIFFFNKLNRYFLLYLIKEGKGVCLWGGGGVECSGLPVVSVMR